MNDTFRQAKIKLTFWYLLIMMAVSASFSFIVYKNFTIFTRRAFIRHELRLERYFPPPNALQSLPFPNNDSTINELNEDLIGFLLSLNFIILVFSGFLSYFLAGKTLEPIKYAVDDQRRFFSDAAHELKTPLTSLKTEIEVNLRDKNFDLDCARDVLKSNLEEVNRLQNLTEGLLYENKYQPDQKQLLKYENLELSKIIEETIKSLKVKADVKNIKIIKNIDNVVFYGEIGSLRKLAATLIDNAIKYSHKDKNIWINLFRDGKKLVFEVKDEGIGIKSTELQYVFNRFYQANNARTKTDLEGFGLGLSIAKNIALLYNGKILVESMIGKGSTFKVILPVK